MRRTRVIRVSCSKHFEIETKQYSFHEHNAYEKIPDLLERLKSGLSLAQVF